MSGTRSTAERYCAVLRLYHIVYGMPRHVPAALSKYSGETSTANVRVYLNRVNLKVRFIRLIISFNIIIIVV